MIFGEISRAQAAHYGLLLAESIRLLRRAAGRSLSLSFFSRSPCADAHAQVRVFQRRKPSPFSPPPNAASPLTRAARLTPSPFAVSAGPLRALSLFLPLSPAVPFSVPREIVWTRVSLSGAHPIPHRPCRDCTCVDAASHHHHHRRMYRAQATRIDSSRRLTHLPPTPARPPPSVHRARCIVIHVRRRDATRDLTLCEPAAGIHRSST